MRRFLLARHGECIDNLERRLPARNSPLSDAGRNQANRIAAALADLPDRPTEIISSALPRAIETAIIIGSKLALASVADERLDEIRFGRAEGLLPEEFSRRFPNHSRAIEDEEDLSFTWPFGESRVAFVERLTSSIGDLIPKTCYPLLITHWAATAMLRAQLVQGTTRQWTKLGLDNGEVFAFWQNAGGWECRRIWGC
ncbi:MULTISPECIES: histidine phosphatase family protein [unclassified Bradyrhizobium]|uniref:histidine phosphatase family protein n=1 Tax=unclassified Bradyrhizobium TaxID=2631580 RepID=UPI0028E72461|nr:MULTISPECIES: histidine phosphatase family protein [unclassified Bradyrhizobium]